MDYFSKEDEQALDALIKRMDCNVGIDRINYEDECIWLSYRNRTGSGGESVIHGFAKVNTAMESVPCAMYEVVKKVFETCVL